jgi:8-oxo-dGTP pyrophosphatase MutT (NUDIX family)
MIWKPNVTVAAMVEREGKFLIVEELADGQIVYNQPAGHLDPGESLIDAAIRETMEETAWQFRPEALVGIYQWTSPKNNITYIRFCFRGQCLRHYPDRPLDTEIQRALWLSRDELLAKGDQIRSPMVLRVIDDYLAGKSYPLDVLHTLSPS